MKRILPKTSPTHTHTTLQDYIAFIRKRIVSTLRVKQYLKVSQIQFEEFIINDYKRKEYVRISLSKPLPLPAPIYVTNITLPTPVNDQIKGFI